MMADVISWRRVNPIAKAIVFPLALGFLVLKVPTAEATLRHQYSFNDGTANDSAAGGTAHGVLGGNAQISAGQLVLDGSAGTIVNLPAATIGVNAYPHVTVAAFATPSSAMTGFTTLLGFGQVNTTDPNYAGNYLILQTHRGDNVSRAALSISNDATPFGEEDFANGLEYNDNAEHHYAMVVRGPTHATMPNTISLFTDGVLRQTAMYPVNGAANAISGISTEFARIGTSYPIDPLFIGSVNRIRIWDEARTDLQILQDFNQKETAGPTLTINRDTGTITLSNQQAAQQVVGYSITSAAGSFNPAAWLSIADNYDADTGGEFDADDNWTELSASGSKTDFSEFEFDGGNGGALGTGGTTSLQIGGNGAWRKSPYQDLLVEMRLDNGTDVPVSIVYTGNNNMPFMRSDLNFDNAINITDWNLFLAKVGTVFTNMSAAETYPMGDLNGDLANNRADFRLFKTDYNIANGAGAFEALIASVPEPSTLTMLFLACAGWLPRRLHRGLIRSVGSQENSATSRTPRSCSRLALLAVATALIALVGEANAVVKNRYSFSEGVAASALGRTIVDSVGGQNGIVRGTAGTGEASATATELILNGGPSATAAYVDLPNGLVSSLTDASFEAWYTMTSAQSWSRIFDFGDTDAAATNGELMAPGGGGNGQDFLFLSPVRGTNLAQQRLGFGNQNAACGVSGSTTCTGTAGAGIYTDLDTEFTHVLNQQYHAVVVIDADGGGPGIATQALYINGVLAPQAPGENQPNPLNSAHQLANLHDVNNWLGRSNWTVDANFGGSFNEFRIWDTAVDESRVTNNFLLGPDADPNATVASLEVNTTTGQVKLKSDYNQPLQIDYYEVTSAAGALNTAGWTSIDGDAVPVGEGWDKAGTSNANQLIELYLPEAGYTLPALGEISIGNAFIAGMPQDLKFGITLATGAFLSGNVSYVTSPGLQGDYNNNGIVDTADYVMWRNDPAAFGGDPAGYNTWRANFGKTLGSGAGSAAAVPEPFTAASFAFGLLAIGTLSRRARSTARRLVVPERRSCVDDNRERSRIMSHNARFVGWPCLALALGLTIAASVDAATRDRWYKFGDDTNETGPAAPGLTPISAFGMTTLDSQVLAANASDAQDLSYSGNPVYFDAGAGPLLRPGASAGQLGLQFDGNDTLVLLNGGLGSPSIGDDGYNGTGAPGYTNITTRYIDGWVRATGGAGTRRDVLNDTAQFGIFINSSNNWGFIHGAVTVNSTTPAVLNTWTHVYSRTFTNTAAVLYVDGVAVAITEADYNTTAASGNIVFGASLDQSTNFFTGQVDDFTIGISGDNTGQTGGQNWGAIDIATENDFIRQALTGKSPADVNLDGLVNQSDINTFVANWLKTNTMGPNNRLVADLNFRKLGDINFNGQVDIDDAWLVSNSIPAGSGVSLDFSLLGTGVPEPGSMILCGYGLASLALFGVRRRK